MLHPDLLLDLADLQHQDRLRDVEIWRLAMQARQRRAKFLGHLLYRLLTATKKQLRVQARPNSTMPDRADLCR